MANKTKKATLKTKQAITGNPISKGMIFLGKAVYSQWQVLLTITAIFMIIVFLLAGMTYAFEQVNPGNNFALPHDGPMGFGDAFWWVYVTISTIGYGDIYPLTGWMRFWAVIISLIGLSFIALYTAVVVNGFTKELQKNKDAGAMSGLDAEAHELEEVINQLKKENEELNKVINDLKGK